MDEETIKHMEEDYKKGFNQGYLIAKYMPELSTRLAEVKSQSPHMEGFRDGVEEHGKEREIYPSWMKQDISKLYGNKDKGDRSKNKDKE